jgi:hypothetical protein
MAHKEQDQVVEQLRAQRYRVFRDKNRHWRVYSPAGLYLATFPGTTANQRWRNKLRTDIRRREREHAQRTEQERALA